MPLSGKVARVIGGTRGIGRGIVEVLAAESAHVVFLGRDSQAGTAVEASVTLSGGIGSTRFAMKWGAATMSRPTAVSRTGLQGPSSQDAVLGRGESPQSWRLALESERPIAHIAADLGINSEVLRKRVRQAEADAGLR